MTPDLLFHSYWAWRRDQHTKYPVLVVGPALAGRVMTSERLGEVAMYRELNVVDLVGIDGEPPPLLGIDI